MSEQEMISTEEIDLRQVVKVLAKWRMVIALITIFAVAVSAVLSFFVLKPVYESNAMLLVTRSADRERVVSNSDNLESLISTVSRIPQMTMNTYVNQLKSDVLFQKVAEKLALDSRSYPMLANATTATALKDTNLIELKVQHNDPVMAARINNTISEQYLQLISENNQEQMTKSVGYLEAERQKVEKELEEILEKLKAFESQPGGVAFLEQQFTTKNQDLSKYQSMLNEARMEMAQAEAGMLQVKEELDKVPETIQVKKIPDEDAAGYTAEEVNPVYVSLSQDYAAKVTKMAEIQAKVAVMESIIGQIRQEVDSIQKQLVEKRSEREKLDAERNRLSNARNLLADEVTETQIAKSIDLGDTSVMVISPAMVPSHPVKPNKTLNMAVALLLGLVMAVAVAFLMEYLDNTVKNPKDVADKLDVPLLGAIPYVGGKR